MADTPYPYLPPHLFFFLGLGVGPGVQHHPVGLGVHQLPHLVLGKEKEETEPWLHTSILAHAPRLPCLIFTFF